MNETTAPPSAGDAGNFSRWVLRWSIEHKTMPTREQAWDAATDAAQRQHAACQEQLDAFMGVEVERARAVAALEAARAEAARLEQQQAALLDVIGPHYSLIEHEDGSTSRWEVDPQHIEWHRTQPTGGPDKCLRCKAEAALAATPPAAPPAEQVREGLRQMVREAEAHGLYDVPELPVDSLVATPAEQGTLQGRVQAWCVECFGPTVAADVEERNWRFLEESLELVQACGGSGSDAHALVEYVFGRPVGEMGQEVGGVMITLAALCAARDLDMHGEAEREYARIVQPAVAARICQKQATKPHASPLPGVVPPPAEDALREVYVLMLESAMVSGTVATIEAVYAKREHADKHAASSMSVRPCSALGCV